MTKPEVSRSDFNRPASENCERIVQATASDLADKISDSVLFLLDIAGYNYAQSRDELDELRHPDR